jgi:hypothetical protein
MEKWQDDQGLKNAIKLLFGGVVLKFELRTLHLLGRLSLVIFQIRSQVSHPGLPWTMIFLPLPPK